MITTRLNRFPLQRFYFRNETDQLLLLSVLFSSVLLFVRMLYTQSIYYIFLEWNLFLAFIPYLISHYLWRSASLRNNRVVLLSLSFCWLLFIPNSFYILTDLFHLGESPRAPKWFDLLLILSFAWNGLIMGILSVRQMEKTFEATIKLRNQLFFVYPVMWLNALGVYIGRYLRFNSWDIITNPLSLISDIVSLLMHPLMHKNAVAMVTLYSVFMTLLYLTLQRMSRRFKQE